MLIEGDVAYFKVLSQHLPGGSARNHDTPQLRQQASWPRFEAGTSSGEVRRIAASTDLLGKTVTNTGSNI
jgi:hypothetical protein